TYCDWYVEASKVSLYKGDAADKHETQVVMLTALDGWLRLLHPIAPFITENLFQELHGEDARLVTDEWRTEFASDQGAQARMQRIMDIVTAIRSIRGEMNVSPGKKVDAHFAVSDALKAELEPQAKVLASLAKLESITWIAADAEVENAAIAPLAELKIFLPLAGLVNVAEELTRVAKNMEKIDKEMGGLSGRLNNAKFVASAPEAVVSKARADLANLEAKRAELETSKAKLEAL
ncbi:MAG: class I tRNA ligase family protein, partial [Gallionellaceae bacterium]